MPDASTSALTAPPPRRHFGRLALKLLLVALLLAGIVRFIRGGVAQLDEFGWTSRQLDSPLLVASAAVYLLGLAPAGVFWWLILRRLGQHPRPLETLRAYFIGHLGKYVPGKALVVILRSGLIRSDRVDTGTAAAAVFCETLTMMSVGAFIGGAVVLLEFRHEVWLAVLALGLMGAAGVPTLPPVFAWLARKARVGKNNPAIVERLARLGYGTLATGWLLNIAGWLLVGTSLWLTMKATGFADPTRDYAEWLACTGGAALAVVAGFASLIPGGLGVRDAVLLVLLTPTFGQGGALVATVVARLVWLVAEVLISIILYGLGRPGRLLVERRD